LSKLSRSFRVPTIFKHGSDQEASGISTLREMWQLSTECCYIQQQEGLYKGGVATKPTSELASRRVGRRTSVSHWHLVQSGQESMTDYVITPYFRSLLVSLAFTTKDAPQHFWGRAEKVNCIEGYYMKYCKLMDLMVNERCP